jgi:adenine-specific DNA-methyltransferase
MNMNNIKDKIENCIKDFQELFVENKLNESKLIDLVCPSGKSGNQELTDKIIERFFEDEEIRKHFFTIKDKYCLFKAQDFKFFIEAGKTFNSYTQFKNEIGLVEGNTYLKHSGDVVLNFPFKDCILEGGQSREDGTDYGIEFDKNGELKEINSKRKEIFFNEIVAKDDIDKLKEPKALTNFQSYGDRTGKINHEKDNMLIKGNNLLALYSLLPKYRGKVKLIYIDPPYNTGNDGFKYNDAFNHSTWLVFMKNRLEVARQLLAEDGVIAVSIDDREMHYMKILLDEIFHRDNFYCNIVWETRPNPVSMSNKISDTHEYILFFTKSISKFSINLLPRTEEMNARYSNPDNDKRGVWASDNLTCGPAIASKLYKLKTPSGRIVEPADGLSWIFTQDRMEDMIADNRVTFGNNGDNMPRLKRFLSEVKDGLTPSTLWKFKDIGGTQHSAKENKELFTEKTFAFPKPEALLERIIQIATKEGDLVLDFFAGSGTTAAVAHKMGRRWITIEQMDYIETITRVRLQKVLEGEQGGISKNHKWTGGGGFAYFELAKWNEVAKEKILACNSLDELKTLFKELYDKYFLNYNLNVKLFFEGQNSQAIIDRDEFKALGLDKQKQIFCNMLDLNQMYVLASEVEDEIYELSKEDIELIKSFYCI